MKSLTGPTPSYVFTVPGVYLVNLTVADAAGNHDSLAMNVTVITVPVWAQSWFWWIIGLLSVAFVSIPFGFRYYRNFTEQKNIVIEYESEIASLPVSHPDRARARYIKDDIERRAKLAEFQNRYGIKIRPAGSFDDALNRLGVPKPGRSRKV